MAKSKAIAATSGDTALVAVDVDKQVQSLMESRLGLLYGGIPKSALRTRIGGGGKSYTYVPHGYVKAMLNRAFGLDWDFALLPVENGQLFHVQQAVRQEFEKGVKKDVIKYNISVIGQLTVRVKDEQGKLITTIKRDGAGSQDWNPANEFGDALKGAASDALKVAASTLGRAFGLQLYYDEKELAEEPIPEELPVPKTVGELISSIAALGMNFADVLEKSGVSAENVKANLPYVWNTAKEMQKAESA